MLYEYFMIYSLYPAASAILRNAINDDIINDYEIPAGTELVLHFGAMMR